MNLIIDESKITEAAIKAERARTISNILVNGYFGQDIESTKDFWKVSGHYYEEGRILAEIVLESAYDAAKMIGDLIEKAEVVRGGRNRCQSGLI